MKREGLMVKWARRLDERHKERKLAKPWIYGPRDKDIMTIVEVAGLLHCSVDKVYRIPRRDLPAHAGAGRHNLYLRDEVVAFVRAKSSKEYNKTSAHRKASNTPVPRTLHHNVVEFDTASALARLKG